LATAAALAATPALARERAAAIDVPAARLDQAVQILGRQSGVSIGFRDARLAGLRVRAVRGRLTAAEALERMLRGTDARARRVAAATFLIEAAPWPEPRPIARAAPRVVQTAADPPDPPPREIVVTGSKRDIPLGAYPGGVQIIDGDSLSEADGARGTDAIVSRVASVASTHLGPGRNKLFIRGIADSSFVGPTQATVGQYWGNSRITYSAPDPSLRLYDIGSIEVLEGPQGTLYGAGSLGGVVRVIPRAPDLGQFGGAAWGGIQAVQHGDPGVDGGAILNLPLDDDRLALRVVGFGAREGGYIDDTGRQLNDVNKVTTYGGRAALRYAPDSGWVFDLNVVGQRIDGEDSQYAERGGDGLSRSSAIAQPYRNDYWLIDFVARKRWGDYELTQSLGYARQYVFEQFDGVAVTATGDLVALPSDAMRNDFVVTDGGEVIRSVTAAAPLAGLTQANRIHMFTAETRLARRGPNGTGWLIGLSLLHNRTRVKREMDRSLFVTALTGVENRVQEATLYGEGTFEPLPRLTLTFGGRLTHSRLSGRSEDVIEDVAFSLDPAARAVRKETRLLPSAALAYRPNDQLTLFARFQQGFRPGGIGTRRDFIQRFKGDRVSTAEAGLRYGSRDLDLTLNAAWTGWSNIQADLIDGFGFPTTANVGDGRVLSLGFTSRWRPLQGLELDASLYLNDTKVTERFSLLPLTFLAENAGVDVGFVESPADTDLAEFKRLPNIADVTGRVGFTYVAALNDRLDVEATGFARYVGKSTLGVGPILGQLQGDYLDTGVEFRVGNRSRGLSLAVTNLLDSRGNRFALGSPFLVRDRNQITPLQPRTVRLGFDMAF
jgi:outer membrane receptor protein involved in Fe transport